MSVSKSFLEQIENLVMEVDDFDVRRVICNGTEFIVEGAFEHSDDFFSISPVKGHRNAYQVTKYVFETDQHLQFGYYYIFEQDFKPARVIR